MSNEKRKRARTKYKTTVRMEVNGMTVQGTCINISMGGALLGMDEGIQIGDKGRISISQYCGQETLQLDLNFRVVRISRARYSNSAFEVGLEFVDLDTENSIELYNVVRYQSSSVMV